MKWLILNNILLLVAYILEVVDNMHLKKIIKEYTEH